MAFRDTMGIVTENSDAVIEADVIITEASRGSPCRISQRPEIPSSSMRITDVTESHLILLTY